MNLPDDVVRRNRERWISHWFGTNPPSDDELDFMLRNVDEVCRGRVKFFNEEKGSGGIESNDTPFDVWVHFSDIEGAGYRMLSAGDDVEFRWEIAVQDSWRCRATWVRKLADRAAP